MTKSSTKLFALSSLALAFASCAHKAPDVASKEVSAYEKRSPASTVEDLRAFERSFRDENLFEYRDRVLATKGVAGVQKHNAELMKLLEEIQPMKNITGSWKPTLTNDQASDLYYWLETHPVAASSNIMKYDPKIQIGFCFGRATAVHLEALRGEYRLHPSSIRKIWVIGPMEGGWGHHVATLVLVSHPQIGTKYVAIDPVTQVVTAKDWINNIRSQYQLSKNDPLMYFVTEPNRFGPFPGKYTQMNLFGPRRGDKKTDAYRNYFHDLMGQFRVDSRDSELSKAFELEATSVPSTVAAMPEYSKDGGLLEDLASVSEDGKWDDNWSQQGSY
jgi:hypothetical protein